MTTTPATLQVRNLVTDAKRELVGGFFNEHIPERYKPLPMMTSEMGDAFEMQVAAIIEDGEVLGAIYWGRDFEDEMQMQANGHEPLAAAMGREVRILQNIAVHPDMRGRGIGRKLNDHMEAMLARAGIRSAVGVATGNSGPFFESLGYHVHESWGRLRIGLVSVKAFVDLPLEGDDVRWFAKSLPTTK